MPSTVPVSVKKFHKNLHLWYASHGRRDLPWRNTQDPYAIYISEVMLQQTQVVTVQERFYAPFLERFPSLEALAKAQQQQVMSAWQGLGYYSRARNLHEAAKSSKGRLPKTVEELMALPGIGRNTAHAVAAFAYHQPVAIMEANVKRVLCRIFAMENPSADALWEKAAQLLDHKNPFDYNQAMMDIGAMVCKKRAPLCGECPAAIICMGKTAPELYPAAKAKKTVPVRKKNIMVMQNADGKYFATKRTSKFLGGLYHFVETDDPPSHKTTLLGHVTQQYSHFTLDANIYLQPSEGSGKEWYSLAQLSRLPFSMAEKKILELL